MKANKRKNKTAKPLNLLFAVCGILGIAVCLGFAVLVVARGLPLFIEGGFAAVLFGREWNPSAGQYGMLPLILSTIYAMLGATALAAPVAVFGSLFAARVLPPRLTQTFVTGCMTMARIPSVIYGLLGIVLLVPWLQRTFGMKTGYSLLAVVLVLAVFILPRMMSEMIPALVRVPRQTELAGYSLGATPVEVWFTVTLKHARLEIVKSVFLCAGRAMGETILYAMLAGGVANMPRLLGIVSSLTQEASGAFGGVEGEFGSALFGAGLVLMVLVALLNLLRRLALRRGGSR